MSGITSLLTFDKFSLENYMQSFYYNAFPMSLYFQIKLTKIHYTVNTQSTIKCQLRKERLSAKWYRNLNAKKEIYHDDPEEKIQHAKKRFDDKKESIAQYIKEQYVEDQTSNIKCQNASCQKCTRF